MKYYWVNLGSICAVRKVYLFHSNVLFQVQLVKEYCSAEVRSVVDFYVNRNAYFAHPELMLITMLASEDESERRFAVKVISTLKYLKYCLVSQFKT